MWSEASISVVPYLTSVVADFVGCTTISCLCITEVCGEISMYIMFHSVGSIMEGPEPGTMEGFVHQVSSLCECYMLVKFSLFCPCLCIPLTRMGNWVSLTLSAHARWELQYLVCTVCVCVCLSVCRLLFSHYRLIAYVYTCAHTHTHCYAQKMETLISLVSDPTVQVQDTAAWTLGRVCDQLPEAALHESCREALLTCLAAGLEKEPRVATNVCWVSESWETSTFFSKFPVFKMNIKINLWCLW